MEIDAFPLHVLRRLELRGIFFRFFQVLIAVYGEINDLTQDMKTAYDAYGQALKAHKMTPVKITKPDSRADSAYMGINYTLKARVNHPDPEIRKAARAVQEVFETYPNPTNKSINEEYGVLESILSMLEALDPAVLETSGAAEWITFLREAVNHVHDSLLRNTEMQAQRDVGATKRTRTALLESWTRFKKRIEVMDEMNHDPKAAEAISQLNVVLAKARFALERRQASASHGQAAADIDFTNNDTMAPTPENSSVNSSSTANNAASNASKAGSTGNNGDSDGSNSGSNEA